MKDNSLMKCKLQVLTTLLLTHKTDILKNINIVYYNIYYNMSWPLEVVVQHKKDQIFSMVNFIRTLSLFFIHLNPALVHPPS